MRVVILGTVDTVLFVLGGFVKNFTMSCPGAGRFSVVKH